MNRNDKNKPKNAGKPWDDTQRKQLREFIANETSIDQIAESMGRSAGALRSELKKLNLKPVTSKNKPVKKTPKPPQAKKVKKAIVSDSKPRPESTAQKKNANLSSKPLENKPHISEIIASLNANKAATETSNKPTQLKTIADKFVPRTADNNNSIDTIGPSKKESAVDESTQSLSAEELRHRKIHEAFTSILHVNDDANFIHIIQNITQHKPSTKESTDKLTIKNQLQKPFVADQNIDSNEHKKNENLLPSKNTLKDLTHQVNKSYKAIASIAKEKSHLSELTKQLALIGKELTQAKVHEAYLQTKFSDLNKKHNTAIDKIKIHSLKRPDILTRFFAWIKHKNILQDWLDKMIDIVTEITRCMKNAEDAKQFISDIKKTITNLNSQKHLLSTALKNSQSRIDTLSEQIPENTDMEVESLGEQDLWEQENTAQKSHTPQQEETIE